MSFETPTTVFEFAAQALQREDWSAAASTCDPVSLRAFKRQQLEQVAPSSTQFELTAEDILRHQPDMPREAAEYQVAQVRLFADPAGRLAREFPGVQSVDELQAMDSERMLAAWMEGRSPRAQIARFINAGKVKAGADSATASIAQRWYNFQVIGVCGDGADVAHVLYRQRVDETADWSGEIATHLAALPSDEQHLARESWARGHLRIARCRRQSDNTWRLHFDHEFLGVGASQIASMGSGSDTEDVHSTS